MGGSLSQYLMGFGGKGRLEPQGRMRLKIAGAFGLYIFSYVVSVFVFFFDLLLITSVPVKITPEAPGAPLCIPSSKWIPGKEMGGS